jgi:RNA polymerase sigma-70 factor (ECF subfamily)
MAADRAPEPRLLDAARQGDEDAFRLLVEPYRAGIHAHSYRMLGSVFDADDVLQETLLRAWRALPRFQGHELLHPWLYRIATNICIDMLKRSRKRGLPTEHGRRADPQDEPGERLTGSLWVEPYPDEAVGLKPGTPRLRRVTSNVRPSSSHSSRLCSTSRLRSVRYSFSATCSASLPKRPRSR